MASNRLQFTTKRPAITFGKISLATSGPTETATSSSHDQSQALNTATTETHVQGFSTFSFKKPDVTNDTPENADAELVEDEEMNRVMGFSSFTTTSKPDNSNSKQKKSARNFDIKEMTDAIRKAKLQEKAGKG